MHSSMKAVQIRPVLTRGIRTGRVEAAIRTDMNFFPCNQYRARSVSMALRGSP